MGGVLGLLDRPGPFPILGTAKAPPTAPAQILPNVLAVFTAQIYLIVQRHDYIGEQ